jgi:hypothetical protein
MTHAPPITFEEIESIIRRLAETRRSDLNLFEEMLGMKFEKDIEGASWMHWRIKSLREPYVSSLFSQRSDASVSRLSLNLNEDLAPVAGEAIRTKYGRPVHVFAIRSMGSEGVTAKQYKIDQATVTFKLSSRSKRLIGWTIEWPF